MLFAALVLSPSLACKGKQPPKKEVRGEQSSSETPVSAGLSAEDKQKAEALLVGFECRRCHEGLSAPEQPENKQCVGCHQRIAAGEYRLDDLDSLDEAVLEGWKRNLHSLPDAPNLAGSAQRLRQRWVRDMLLAPTDHRPSLPATMPRLPLKEDEAELIATYLVPTEAPSIQFDSALVSTGEKLFSDFGCAACHARGEIGVDSGREFVAAGRRGAALPLDRIMAPDLAHLSERFQSAQLQKWLMEPRSVQPTTRMPDFELEAWQADALAAYLWQLDAPLRASEAPKIERLPVLERPVGWDEVFEKVIKKVCWHCHSSANLALGDGGPGNTGGFGFEPRGLDLSNYQGIRSGAIGKDGQRESIFRKDESGLPLILRVMLARKSEEAGFPAEGIRGMPLGFPSMSLEEIQLVESWIEQGRPEFVDEEW